MPNTIIGIIITLFAILPGFPGYALYSNIVGANWRLRDWEKIVWVLVFSVAGFILHSIFADLLHLIPPIYGLLSINETTNLTIGIISDISKSLVVHTFLSTLAGAVVAILALLLSKCFPTFVYVSTWDIFIRHRVPNRWVVVGLTTGEAYAGFIDTVDVSVTREERDIILYEPAVYQPENGNYLSLDYQSIYLPSKLISSIAIVYNQKKDKRVTKPGKNIFSEGGSNG